MPQPWFSRYLPLLTCLMILAACARTPDSRAGEPMPAAEPTGAPAATPPPLTTPGSREAAGSAGEACYLFAASYAEQLGGRPAAIESVYLSRDGTAQLVRERSDDTVQALQSGQAATAALLGRAAAGWPEAAASSEAEGGAPVEEYSGPTLEAELGLCDGSFRLWSGPADRAPADLANLLAAALAVARGLPAAPLEPGQHFARSLPLTPEEATFLREAGVITTVSVAEVASLPLLGSVLALPRRLITIEPGASLYGSLPLSATPGASTSIAFDQQLYQIRHLAADDAGEPT